ncbi:DUF6106 family protein [Coprococcus sp. AF21-14LB]|uniref:DUF6106 family protein n=1 Tax=Coprococcus sp. AF21-14LB TaxID=2292231 RepID=UPI000E517A55|nr:DUF6106 family protein [Coprococcus sp. AF21-14LB]RGS80473.1 hypothetical protein DWX73_05440 [Coprococcus sp. AF21-14LB]
MSDFYTEQLIRRKTPITSILLVSVCGAFTIISVLSMLILPFGLLITAALGALTYFVHRSVNLEFEYLYVNGDLDIDKIMAKTKRKKVFSCNMRDLEVIAPQGAPELRPFANLKAKDFSSNCPDHKKYEMILVSEGEKHRIIFEPNKTILDGIRMIAPRKVIM